MTDETTPSDGAPRVTGETPVVRAVNDVPAEVLDELTTAFEKHTGDVPVVSSASQTTPTIANTETVLIDGYDLVADDDLTHARKPPLVIDDNDLTGPVARIGEDGDESDGVVKRDRRFRLRRIAVRRAEGRRRLRIVGWILLPLAIVGAILAVLASSLFGVRNIEIDGARYTAKSTLDAADDLVRGKSVFSLDLGAVEEVLKADPWVRDAQAKRRFPSTVVLDIAERKPIAWYLGADNQARMIDIDGRVITVLAGQPTAYTQITGIGPDLPAGAQADDAYTAAAQVAASLPPEVAPLMLNMGVTGGTDLLMTLRTGTVVTFGRPTDLRSKMVALVLVLRRTDPKSLNGIDLSSGDPILAGR
jgi:cell division protein FtsQ